jgi:hypothetical protein
MIFLQEELKTYILVSSLIHKYRIALFVGNVFKTVLSIFKRINKRSKILSQKMYFIFQLIKYLLYN